MYILETDFERASRLISEIAQDEPGNNFRLLVENYRDFIKVNIHDDYRAYLDVKDAISLRIETVENDLSEDQYHRWLLGDLYFQQGILRLKFGEYISGARSVKKSLDLLSENKKRYPAFIYSYKYLGMMHAAISSIPPEYQWISSLMGIKGSLAQGLSELETVLKEGHQTDPFITEAKLLYLFSLMTFGNPENSMGKVDHAISMIDSKNPLGAFFLSSAYFKLNRNEEVIRVLNGFSRKPYPYLDYLSGIAHLNRLDYTDACEDLKRFLSRGKGQNYIKAGYLKLAWCELLKGDVSSYYRNLELVETKGSMTTDEDKLAMNEFRKKRIPATGLLKARLLFDGGYYEDAEKVLASIENEKRDEAESIEYTYRYGRIRQRQKQTGDALRFYQQTITSDPESKTWFPASAALQSGLIYEQSGDVISAQKFFELCLDIDPPEYKASLHQKAKAGLSRIKKDL